MIDFFAQTLERLLRQTLPAAEWIAMVAPAPRISPVRLVAAYAGDLPVALWHGPPRAEESTMAIVGFGETVRFDGHGTTRVQQVSAETRAMYAALRREHAVDAEAAPGPFVVGGLSFQPRAECAKRVEEEAWTAFADASFSLPRWTYVRRGEHAWWWLCVGAEEVKHESRRIRSEWGALQRAMLRSDTLRRPSGLSTSVTRFDIADRDAYCALVAEAIACIRTHATDKIVAVTSSRVTFGERIDTRVVLERLDEAYPETTRFAVQRGEHMFVGASPERLVARRGRHIESDGLAGTARRGSDDDSIVQGLLTSVKDRREHALVVESIASVLGPRCSTIDVPDKPIVRTLRNVHHLWTPIRGVLRNETHVLDLVEVLHPTPAVAGTPRDRATAWIAEHEPSSRGWYTGAVGYFDAAGDGEFAVAIRAGLVGKHEAFLYAGAGIVEASDPPAEYAETRAKEAPMLAALGIAP